MSNCAKCGKPKTAESSGSLTQWLSECSCDSLQDGEKIEVAICKACGKRLSAGRAGSFTQWVFRADLCSCNLEPFAKKPTPAKPPRRKRVTEQELMLNAPGFPRDRYKALMKLGNGASGDVYLCRDKVLAKKVAIKTLRQITANELVNFQMEAKATSMLMHPNIVKVYDFGANEVGSPYMVMEYIGGKTLQTILEENGSMPWHMTFQLALTVLDALEYAHAAGVLHRDLKPSNILVSEETYESARVSLIDFGVAKVKSMTVHDPTIVQGITLVGTPMYMSPDQSNGHAYDERSEVYSFGCILYECINGQPPFKAATALEILSLHHNAPPPEFIENFEHPVPEEAKQIVFDCLEKNPDDRFQNAAELKHAIQKVLRKHSPDATAYGALQDTGLIDSSIQVQQQIQPEPETGKPASWLVPAMVILSIVMLVTAPIIFWSNAVQQKNEKKEKKQVHNIPEKGTPLSKFELYFTVTAPGECTAHSTVTDERLLNVPSDIYAIDLSSTNTTNQALKNLSGRKMRGLKLGRQKLDEETFQLLTSFKDLRELEFINSSINDAQLKDLSVLHGLRTLGLESCRGITNASMDTIVQLWPELDSLVVSESGMTASGLKSISRLKKLKHLGIAGIKLDGGVIDNLLALPLRTLDLSSTDSRIDMVEKLVDLKSLRMLELTNNAFLKKAEVSQLVAAMPQCRIIYYARENLLNEKSDEVQMFEMDAGDY